MTAQNNMRLWYTCPPPRKNEDKQTGYPDDPDIWERWSLPLGNGYFGVNAFGYNDTERIQITDVSLANPRVMTKVGSRYGVNNFAELYIDFGHENVTDYVRSLDLDTATASVSYTYNGVKYNREYFASYADKVMVMKFTADKNGSVTLCACPKIPYLGDHCVEEGDGCGKFGTVTAEGDTITLSGVMEYYDLKFEGQLKVVANGGAVKADGDKIYVNGADDVVMIFACGTNYKMESRVFTEEDPKKKVAPYEHPHARISQYIADAAIKGYNELRNAHLADYKGLYDRVKINIGAPDNDIPTDKLLEAYKDGKESRYLETLLYQYGRYLLIACSRPGCLPATLQGIWNCYNSSPWSCGYWHNINVQMNYWPSEIANLSELFLPYAEYNRAYMDLARKYADEYVKALYPQNYTEAGTNGWIIGTAAWLYTITGLPMPEDTGTFTAHSGPGTGAFTSLLFWDYYDYTRDEKFLREICYPVLRDMSVFFSKALIEHEGKMLIEYSASPENIKDGKAYQTMGCAFDQQMVYENYKRTLEAADILGISEPIIEVIKSQIDRLDPVLVGESGQVKEYREERFYGDIGEYAHRHISQLVGLYPGTIINSTTKEWLAAAEVTLTERGDKSTGWALAHRLCLWSRAKNGKKSMDLIRSLLQNKIFPNLWDTHPPFQIDGNFGYTAGVSEMFLQSQAGFIELLQAIPDEWKDGSFSGLVARGNFVVDCDWKDKKATKVKVLSRAGEKLSLFEERLDSAKFTFNGKEFIPEIKNNLVSVDTNAGDVLEIEF